MCNQNDSSLQASAGIFIWLLQVNRQSLGLSVNEAAELAGMEATDWLAIEAGRLPELNQLRPMADTLELKVEQLAVLDRVRRKACEA
jgi:predicted transcriptional regulator